MLGPTRLQQLERENKDLRARLENRRGKAELAQLAMEGELAELRAKAARDGKTISMLQKEIAGLAALLEGERESRSKAAAALAEKAAAEAKAPLLSELSLAHNEILRLKAIINKDSGNSSKPPSRNGYKHVQNSRVKTGKARGGQPGHPGRRLALPANIGELMENGTVEKKLADHTNGSEEYVSRYVIDVEVVTTVTEHRFALGSEIPQKMYNEVSYGDNIRAMSVLLLSEGVIAEKRFSGILRGLTRGAVAISPATLEKFLSEFAWGIEINGELGAIREDLLNGEVMNTDDSSMKNTETAIYNDKGEAEVVTSEKKSFANTIRTYSNERSTLYTVNPQKDNLGVIRDGVLPYFLGICAHDHEAKFYKYGSQHATCGEHLCRDLKGLLQLQMVEWARGARAFIYGMHEYKKLGMANDSAACPPDALERFEGEYDDWVVKGRRDLSQMQEGDFGFEEFENMLDRLTKYKDCYMLFMRNYKAPFTNNLAERDLRPCKVKLKVSGLFRSWEGIKNFAKIRSFISTAKKRGVDLFSAISKANSGVPVLQRGEGQA
jgi:hypothetical protein